MKTDSVFYIDDKPYPLDHSSVKVSALLDLADTSSDDTLLVAPNGLECGEPGDLVDIAPNAHFTTKKRDIDPEPIEKPICYTVNGESNTTVENPVSVRTILEGAGAGAAIDVADLGSYFLENTVDRRKYESVDDLVTISEGDNFLAIHVGSTPVA